QFFVRNLTRTIAGRAAAWRRPCLGGAIALKESRNMSRPGITRLLAAALIAVAGTAMLAVSFDAEARRMGGGGSFGRQSSNITQQRQPTTPSTATTTNRSTAPATGAAAGTAAAGTAAKSGMSRWLGPIAGIAAGLGIAALLSHLGLSGAFAEFLSSML